MKVQKQKEKTLSPIENVKLFKACEVNHNRKTYNKLWIDVKEEALPIVESLGGSVINKKKSTTRFDVKSFKEKHPEIYNSFIVEGEAIELKTKIVK